MQKITQSFPVSVVSVPDSVISVSVLYRDHFSEGEALLNMRQTAKNTRLVANCQFYQLVVICQQVATSCQFHQVATSLGLLQHVIFRLVTACSNNLQQACWWQVIIINLQQVCWRLATDFLSEVNTFWYWLVLTSYWLCALDLDNWGIKRLKGHSIIMCDT